MTHTHTVSWAVCPASSSVCQSVCCCTYSSNLPLSLYVLPSLFQPICLAVRPLACLSAVLCPKMFLLSKVLFFQRRKALAASHYPRLIRWGPAEEWDFSSPILSLLIPLSFPLLPSSQLCFFFFPPLPASPPLPFLTRLPLSLPSLNCLFS